MNESVVEQAITTARMQRVVVEALTRHAVLRQGIDYGVVPGTAKPTLLKPGAERLCAAFGLVPHFETLEAVERWDAEQPLFFYRILCKLRRASGEVVATGIGSCNSMEARYRWRWVQEHELPAGINAQELLANSATISEFEFAIRRAETHGKYGKPATYWKRWQEAIQEGRARKVVKPTRAGELLDAWEMDVTSYRIPNTDIFSLVNTIDKMAQKRALVAAVLIGTGASEFFTQDLEDLAGVVLGDEDIVVPATRDDELPADARDDAPPAASARVPYAEALGDLYNAIQPLFTKNGRFDTASMKLTLKHLEERQILQPTMTVADAVAAVQQHVAMALGKQEKE